MPPRKPRRLVRVEYEELPAVISVTQALDPVAATRPGSVAQTDASAQGHEPLPGMDVRMGRRREREGGSRHRARLRVPDGHALRDRAARLHGGARRERRHDLEPDSAPLCAAARRGRLTELAALEGPHHRARFRRWLRREGLAEIRAARRVPRAAARAARPARADARGDVPAGAPNVGHACARGRASRATASSSFRTSRRTSCWARTRTSASVWSARRATRRAGPYKTPNARVLARALLSHTTPTTAFRGFGTPQASWAVESQLTEAARRLGHRSGRDSTPQRSRKGRSVHPERHAVRRRLAAGDPARGQGARLGQAARPEPRTRHLARAEELVDGLRVAGDRPASLRRQRLGALGDVRHGAGRAYGALADCRRASSASNSIGWPS